MENVSKSVILRMQDESMMRSHSRCRAICCSWSQHPTGGKRPPLSGPCLSGSFARRIDWTSRSGRRKEDLEWSTGFSQCSCSGSARRSPSCSLSRSDRAGWTPISWCRRSGRPPPRSPAFDGSREGARSLSGASGSAAARCLDSCGCRLGSESSVVRTPANAGGHGAAPSQL